MNDPIIGPVQSGVPLSQYGPGRRRKYQVLELLKIGDSVLIQGKTVKHLSRTLGYWGDKLKRKFSQATEAEGVRIRRLR